MGVGGCAYVHDVQGGMPVGVHECEGVPHITYIRVYMRACVRKRMTNPYMITAISDT